MIFHDKKNTLTTLGKKNILLPIMGQCKCNFIIKYSWKIVNSENQRNCTQQSQSIFNILAYPVVGDVKRRVSAGLTLNGAV